MKGDFSWIDWPAHRLLLNILSHGGEARFVGGAVRNTLMGLAPEDFDLATTHPPEKTMSLVQSHGFSVIPTGLAHGTVTALVQGRAYEITTLRRDTQADGRWAKIEYTSSWQEDAARRDFTMNALYIDGQGRLYDYFGGQQDTYEGRLRFIGDPAQRIHEDYLRILRLFRFWAHYGQKVDPESLTAACALKRHLALLSRERITKEIMKLLEASDPWPVLRFLSQESFFPLILDESATPDLLPYVSGLEHALKSLLSPLARLASVAQSLYSFSALVLSRQQKRNLAILGQPLSWDQALESVYQFSLPVTQERLILQTARLFSQEQRPFSPQDPFFLKLKDTLSELVNHPLPPFPVTGGDLVKLGFAGPEVGIMLHQLKSWWVSRNGEPSREEVLSSVKR